jgi:hypothetical protein
MEDLMSRAATILVISLAAVLLAAGCGGGFKVGSPWNPNEARFFDDGIDLIKQPSKLGGEWAYNHEEELDARINLGDLTALVSVLTVQTTTDIEGKEAKRIEAQIVEEWYGKSPTETVFLQSSKASLGYPLILRHERHLTGKFLVFIRWFDEEDGSLGHHFHLSPASTEMRKKVQGMIDKRREEEERLKMAQ